MYNTDDFVFNPKLLHYFDKLSRQYFLLAKMAASYSFIFLLLLGFVYDLGMGEGSASQIHFY